MHVKPTGLIDLKHGTSNHLNGNKNAIDKIKKQEYFDLYQAEEQELVVIEEGENYK